MMSEFERNLAKREQEREERKQKRQASDAAFMANQFPSALPAMSIAELLVHPQIGQCLREAVFCKTRFLCHHQRLGDEHLAVILDHLIHEGLSTTITFMDISNNLFTQIPSQIGCFTSLQTLALQDNPRLADLPADLYKCEMLMSLKLPANESLGRFQKFNNCFVSSSFVYSIYTISHDTRRLLQSLAPSGYKVAQLNVNPTDVTKLFHNLNISATSENETDLLTAFLEIAKQLRNMQHRLESVQNKQISSDNEHSVELGKVLKALEGVPKMQEGDETPLRQREQRVFEESAFARLQTTLETLSNSLQGARDDINDSTEESQKLLKIIITEGRELSPTLCRLIHGSNLASELNGQSKGQNPAMETAMQRLQNLPDSFFEDLRSQSAPEIRRTLLARLSM